MSKLWNFPLQPHKAKFWMTLLQDDESSQVMEFGFRFTKVAITKLSKSISTLYLLLCFSGFGGGGVCEDFNIIIQTSKAFLK